MQPPASPLSAPAAVWHPTGAAPLVLSGVEGVWRVESGALNLFAAPLDEEGRPAGRRCFLGRVPAGEAVFGLPRIAGAPGIIAVGSLDALVQPMDLHGLKSAAAADWIDAWIERTAVVAGPATPARARVLNDDEGGRHVAAGEPVCARDVRWIAAARADGDEAVSFQPFGVAEAPLDGLTPAPVSRHLWIEASDTAALSVSPTRELAAVGAVWPALEAWHRTLPLLVARRVEARNREADDAGGARRRAAKGDRSRGLLALAEAARPGAARTGAPAVEPPQLAAFRAVAGVLNADVPDRVHMRGALDVRALATAAGLRSRRVLLQGRWWRHDVGALLAWRRDGAPVALLPGSGGSRLFDPATGRSRWVGRETAATLRPEAQMLYRRLPDRELGLRDLLSVAGREGRRDVRRLAVAGGASALLGLAPPVALGFLVEAIIPAADRGQMVAVIAGLVAAALGVAGFHALYTVAIVRLETRLDRDMQAALVDRVLRLPVRALARFSAGDLADRVLALQALRQVLSASTVGSLLGGIFALTSFGLLFVYSWRLALVAVALALAAAAVTAALGAAQVRHERRRVSARGRTEGLVLQILSGIGKLRVADAVDRAMAVWARRYAEQKTHLRRARMVANAQTVQRGVWLPAGTILIFAGMVHMGEGSPTAIGDFVAFYAAFGQFIGSITRTGDALVGALQAIPLTERLRPILAQPTEDVGPRRDPGVPAGGIEMSGVSFRYDEDGPLVLDDVSFSIAPGEAVAVVGPSGSGKSTILRLLMGFEAPASGEIFFDGMAARTLDMRALRRSMGVVMQNARVRPGTILSNIVGAGALDEDAAWRAAARVGLDADIRAMPMAMHTVLPDGGTTLSGGQRQRLLLARALAHDPPIVLLDEATSALDNPTQNAVVQTLERLAVTRIVVAHRLSTIRAADRILVVREGRIVEAGTYDDLRTQAGEFAALARRQET